MTGYYVLIQNICNFVHKNNYFPVRSRYLTIKAIIRLSGKQIKISCLEIKHNLYVKFNDKAYVKFNDKAVDTIFTFANIAF